MHRRTALLAALPWPWWAHAAEPGGPAALADGALRIATAWQRPATGETEGRHCVAVLQVHWAEGRVQVLAEHTLPSRAHGLLARPDGGCVVVANRPGRWLMRLDAQGNVAQRLSLEAERPPRTLNGHVEAGTDGAWLYTTETDPATGAGWLSVRDPQTLVRVAQFESHGIDPHQLLPGPDAADPTLMVANGGIARDALGRKLPTPMAPALVQLDARTGALRGRWTLPDPQLSLRHMAWNTAWNTAWNGVSKAPSTADADSPPLRLGLALQAEHAALQARATAPVLAVWQAAPAAPLQGEERAGAARLTLQGAGAAARLLGGGYAGDIAAAPGGGFVLSAQKQGRALWWHPARPEDLTPVAQVTEPCGLLPLPEGGGVALSAGRGLARWHLDEAPRMLPWPALLAPDNHWVALARA